MEWRVQCMASSSRTRWFFNNTANRPHNKTKIFSSVGIYKQLDHCLSMVVIHIHSPFWKITCCFNLSRYSFAVWRIGNLLRIHCEPLFQIKKITQSFLGRKYFCILLDASRTCKSGVLHRFSMGRDRLCTY